MSKSTQVRTRFAPSPTGFVHIGNFRTALFAFLFARHNGGVNLLRVEDTDQARKTEGAMENMLRVMAKMGVIYDEGVCLTGNNLSEVGELGPYTQSARLEIYQTYVQQLLDASKAYYCFCSSERLDELRKEQMALKQPAMYDRHCRNLSNEELTAKQQEFEAAGQKPVVRFAIPLEGETILNDLVFGEIKYQNVTLDDQVLIKSDGFPTYHLAVVVDDHFMEISHVIRGEEWIPSTPKHLLLYDAFGWTAPEFAHLPLILNPDKSKLSKRQGDVAVEDFLTKGYLPEALVNFVALLGWNPKTEQEIFSMEELVAQFDLAKVNKSGAVLDMEKLSWMNGMYLRDKTDAELLELCRPYLEQSGLHLLDYSDEFLLSVIAIEKERLKTLAQITEQTGFYFAQPKYDGAILIWKKANASDAKEKLQAVKDFLATWNDSDFAKEAAEEKLKAWIEEQGFETGNVLWPLRVALSGLEKSPSPFELLGCLGKNGGKEGIVTRLETAIKKL
jgi:nondiscriminating glutamyl-tRNA synthetase